MNTGRAWASLAIMLLAVALAGCSSTSPPCEVEPGQIEQVRVDLDSAQAEIDQVEAELEGLEGQLDDLQDQRVSDAELADMQQRLEELKKGSGR